MDKYVFLPYDPILQKLFKTELERLRTFLNKAVKIEHVGSTAVPGLGGKGFIDIVIGSKTNLNEISKELEKAGYTYRPDASTDTRWFHKHELPDELQGVRRYHIHLTKFGSKEWVEMIAFRDYLRTHPEAVNKYAAIKKHAASISGQQREVYVKTKDPIIKELIAKALELDKSDRKQSAAGSG